MESSLQNLHCYSCSIKELRSTSEIVDNDIILCNQCGSECVEFMPIETPKYITTQERHKQIVDGEIKKLFGLIFFCKKVVTPNSNNLE